MTLNTGLGRPQISGPVQHLCHVTVEPPQITTPPNRERPRYCNGIQMIWKELLIKQPEGDTSSSQNDNCLGKGSRLSSFIGFELVLGRRRNSPISCFDFVKMRWRRERTRIFTTTIQSIFCAIFTCGSTIFPFRTPELQIIQKPYKHVEKVCLIQLGRRHPLDNDADPLDSGANPLENDANQLDHDANPNRVTPLLRNMQIHAETGGQGLQSGIITPFIGQRLRGQDFHTSGSGTLL